MIFYRNASKTPGTNVDYVAWCYVGTVTDPIPNKLRIALGGTFGTGYILVCPD